MYILSEYDGIEFVVCKFDLLSDLILEITSRNDANPSDIYDQLVKELHQSDSVHIRQDVSFVDVTYIPEPQKFVVEVVVPNNVEHESEYRQMVEVTKSSILTNSPDAIRQFKKDVETFISHSEDLTEPECDDDYCLIWNELGYSVNFVTPITTVTINK